MKVTFVASVSQKSTLEKYYKRILDVLKRNQLSVFSGSLFLEDHSTLEDQKSREKWYKESIQHIKESDLVIIEMSYPSAANVGHELTFALDIGKPVVALYLEGRNPLFLQGIVNEKLLIVPYSDDDLETVLSDALDYANEQQDTRFNFFISPKHQHYLDWVSKNRMIPRAVFLRKLIEREMEKDEEYNS